MLLTSIAALIAAIAALANNVMAAINHKKLASVKTDTEIVSEVKDVVDAVKTDTTAIRNGHG